jgi:hypothetical protein
MWFPGIAVPFFTVFTAITVAILVSRGYYRSIQQLSVVMIGLFTLFTLTALYFLHFTPYSIHWANIVEGLKFRFQPGTIAVAIAAFGLTGVAGDEIVAYHYWCLEKGYARYTGPTWMDEDHVPGCIGFYGDIHCRNNFLLPPRCISTA